MHGEAGLEQVDSSAAEVPRARVPRVLARSGSHFNMPARDTLEINFLD